MNIDRLNDNMQALASDLASVKAKQDGLLKNFEGLQNLAVEMGRLNVNLENLANQTAQNGENLVRFSETMGERIKGQGERIGGMERNVERNSLLIEKNSTRLDLVETKLEEIKLRGVKRLNGIVDGIVDKLIYVFVGAAIFYLIYRMGFMTGAVYYLY